jgi:hypothetical protein
MRFVCLGYADHSIFEQSSEEEMQGMMQECFAYDGELRRGGHFSGGEALQPADGAVTLRFENGKVAVTDGPFAETKEQLGGILLLEARDLNHAIALMSKHPGVRIGPFEIRPADVQINELVAGLDEAEVRRIIADQLRAIEARDVDGIMADYAPDVVAYDAIPPFVTRGADAWRKIWANCLPYFPETFAVEQRDLEVHVGGDVAHAHWLFRFTGPDPDHPAMQTWMRLTGCYRRIEGRWRIVHEHCSVPFDPMTTKAAFTLEP